MPGAGSTLPYLLSEVRMPAIQRHSHAYREAYEQLYDYQLGDLTASFVTRDQGLKIMPGETIVLCDGKGSEVHGTMIESTASYVRIDVGAPRAVTTEPKLRLHLFAALIRPELFELMVQKTAELGIAEITPLITERTIRTGFKRARLESIAKEAAELAGRGIVPIIHDPTELTNVIARATDRSPWLVADQGGGDVPPSLKKCSEVGLFIGPEGGWTDRERDMFKQVGISSVGLGSTVLRAETAAIAGCFMLINRV